MKSISLNNQQLKAIDHNRNIVLNAGAGTGKTHVLVERIVNLLEYIESLELKHIVALTFTIKAASELQDRLKNAFLKKINKSDNHLVRQKFKRSLEQLSQANISTIHGFLNRCLRTYSMEANLDSQYRIINDYERIEIKESAIIQSLKTQLLNNNTVTYLYQIYGRYDFFRLMSELLENPQLLEMINFSSVDDLKEFWLNQQKKYKQDLLENIRTDRQFKFILETVSKFRLRSSPNKESTEFRQALQQVYLDLTDLTALSILYQSFIKKSDGLIKQRLLDRYDSNNHNLLEQLAEKVKYYSDQILPDFNSRDEDYFMHYLDLLSFAKEVVSVQYKIKREANVIDFNDLEIQCKRLFDTSHLAKSELRSNYRFFLIDEFQDTNLFQWQILEQLLINDRKELHPQKTFIVGDPKQSIYGFRNADVRVFTRVSNELIETNRLNNSLTKSFTFSKDMNSTLSEKEGLIVLNENYRSDKNIVHLVNNLFEHIFNSENEYDVKSQSLVKRNPDLDHNLDNELILAVSKESDLEYQLICQRIIQTCQTGFSYKDICILLRNRTNSELLESALKKHRIPYQSFLNQNFFNRQEIYDAYSLIRFVNYPEDDIALTSVLKSPFFKLSDSELYQLHITDRKSSLLNLLTLKKHPLMEGLNLIRSLAARMPIYDWLNYCFFQFDYFDANPLLRNQHEANINKLIEMIQNRSKNSVDDLFSIEVFIKKQIDDSFEESEAEIIINQNDNKVQLMTIHNSKGLEFPVVIICDMNKSTSRSSDTLFINFDYGFYLNCSLSNEDKIEKGFCESFFKIKKLQRELAEEKRILYVAMTRAQKKIILSGTMTENKIEKIRQNSFLDLIRLSTKQNFIKTGQIKLADSVLTVKLIEANDDPSEIAKIEDIRIEAKKEKFSLDSLAISKGNYFSVTFKAGLQYFADKIIEHNQLKIIYNQQVKMVRQGNDKMVEMVVNDSVYKFDKVIMTTPSYVSAHLLKDCDEEFYRALGLIKYAPLAVVNLAYDHDLIKQDAYGYQVPASENQRMLSCIYNHKIFPDHSPGARANLTVILGGPQDFKIMEKPAHMIIKTALKHLENHLEIAEEPIVVRIRQYSRAIPQYNMGVEKVWERMDAVAEKYENIILASNYRHGIQLKDCVKLSKKIADSIN